MVTDSPDSQGEALNVAPPARATERLSLMSTSTFDIDVPCPGLGLAVVPGPSPTGRSRRGGSSSSRTRPARPVWEGVYNTHTGPFINFAGVLGEIHTRNTGTSSTSTVAMR